MPVTLATVRNALGIGSTASSTPIASAGSPAAARTGATTTAAPLGTPPTAKLVTTAAITMATTAGRVDRHVVEPPHEVGDHDEPERARVLEHRERQRQHEARGGLREPEPRLRALDHRRQRGHRRVGAERHDLRRRGRPREPARRHAARPTNTTRYRAAVNRRAPTDDTTT